MYKNKDNFSLDDSRITYDDNNNHAINLVKVDESLLDGLDTQVYISRALTYLSE